MSFKKNGRVWKRWHKGRVAEPLKKNPASKSRGVYETMKFIRIWKFTSVIPVVSTVHLSTLLLQLIGHLSSGKIVTSIVSTLINNKSSEMSSNDVRAKLDGINSTSRMDSVYPEALSRHHRGVVVRLGLFLLMMSYKSSAQNPSFLIAGFIKKYISFCSNLWWSKTALRITNVKQRKIWTDGADLERNL